jgi:hypothetical protein
MLNEDQSKAIEFLEDFRNSQEIEALLLGSAGVGKSYTLHYWVENYRVNSCIITPTHKARKVIADLGDSYYISNVLTLHSQFNLRPWINYKTGEQVFKIPFRWDKKFKQLPVSQNIIKLRDSKKFNYIPYKTEIIICDECSMIRDSEYKIIKDHCVKMGLKILWVGDRLQLPPVQNISKYNLSYPLEIIKNKYEITQPVRNTGEIYNYCQQVRKSIELLRAYPPEFEKFRLNAGWLNKAINSFKRDEDTKIIAYRNNTVAKYNSKVRDALWGDEAIDYPFIIGEKLIFNAPYKDVANNSDEVIITDIDILTSFLPDSLYSYSTNNFTIGDVIDFENYEFTWFEIYSIQGIFYKVLEYKQWSEMLSKIKDTIKKDKRKGAKKQLWQLYYAIKESNAEVSYSYAITADKSQGSTYSKVFIDSSDIMLSKELKRFYVAVSRAKEQLWIK